MSCTILRSQEIKKAGKDHVCNACEWLLGIGDLREIFSTIEMTLSEKKTLVRMKNNGWKIKKGEPCVYVVGICDGDFGGWYYNKEVHEICVKYDVYLDD